MKKERVIIDGKLNENFDNEKQIIFIAQKRYSERNYKNRNIVDQNEFKVYTGYFKFERSINQYLLHIVVENDNSVNLCVERHIPGYTENEIMTFDDINEAYIVCKELNYKKFSEMLQLEEDYMKADIEIIKRKYIQKINLLKNAIDQYE